MKSIVSSLLLVAITFCCYAQSNTGSDWPDSLNTAKNANYLTGLEKLVVFEMNKVRSNPKKYANYIKEQRIYYDGLMVKKTGEIDVLTKEGLKAVEECITFLENTNPVGLLIPNADLAKASRDHAKDLSKTGLVGHQGSDGSMPLDRIARYNDRILIGENISFGYSNAFDIVFQLLVDDGIPLRGHRSNIMNAEYKICGLSAGSHPKYSHLCVIDYGYVLRPNEFIIRESLK